MMLVNEIVPLIASAVARGAVRPTGCEDREELQAEGQALAATMLDRLEARRKVVTAGNIAFYALQGLRSGRRSGYAGRADAMSAAAALDRRVQFRSMDESLGVDPDDPGHDLTLHDLLASGCESADVTAPRRLDWDAALERMDPRMRGVLEGTAEGVGTGEMAARYHVSPPRICQVREAAGETIREVWGGDPVNMVGDTRWQRHVRVAAERRACRGARSG
jgi:hypothetical protein